MARFLRPDSPVYRAWSSAADLVIVNVLTLLACLPLVTAGAALTACARVTMEMARDEDLYVVRTWWRSFRGNLLQSLAWWPVAVLLGVLVVWENRVLGAGDDGGAGALGGLLLACALLLVAVLVWLVPLIAFFNNTVRAHLANAVRLAVGHLGRTTLCLVVVVGPFGLAWLLPASRTGVVWFMLLLGVAFMGYLMALVQRGVIDTLRAASSGC